MKHLLLLFSVVAFLGLSLDATAQGFVEAPKKGKSSTELVDVTIDGLTLKGGVTKSGNTFVVITSQKSGKQYRKYLGKNTGLTFDLNGRQVPVFELSHRDGSKSYQAVYANDKGGLSTKKSGQRVKL